MEKPAFNPFCCAAFLFWQLARPLTSKGRLYQWSLKSSGTRGNHVLLSAATDSHIRACRYQNSTLG